MSIKLKKSQISKICAITFIGGFTGGPVIAAGLISFAQVQENPAFCAGIIIGAILAAIVGTIYESAAEG